MKEGKSARVNYVEDDEDTRSRSDSGRVEGSEIGKMIQAEIAKYMAQLPQKSQGTHVANDVNIVHQSEVNQSPFDVHYAFSVLSSMEKNVWIIDSGASSHV